MKAMRSTGTCCAGQASSTPNSLAAVTDKDALNAVVGHLAHGIFHVPNVVVRNYDPRYRRSRRLMACRSISPLSWGAQRIEEMMYHSDVRAVFSAGNGEVEVYEICDPDGCAGQTLWRDHGDTEMCMPWRLPAPGKPCCPT